MSQAIEPSTSLWCASLRARALLALAVGCLMLGIGAQPASAEVAQMLICTFSNGQVSTFENGKFRSEATAPLTFEIGEIDLEGQVATLHTTRGKGELRVVRAINANHFLEVVTEGFLNITTVYDVGGAVYPAIHSRHLGLLGQPVGAQYNGECRAKS